MIFNIPTEHNCVRKTCQRNLLLAIAIKVVEGLIFEDLHLQSVLMLVARGGERGVLIIKTRELLKIVFQYRCRKRN